ncbi:hypothetical protein ElyMa_002205500 [Elysia marginata]|uniref:Uncharacterized protein n=1 Tax=Elysia marginata TaxID=1093978 RepID=A0AAV4FS48_9GAST|nr:hypothetical protein ElyMa_002205500 [Elysia marginata]
MLYTSAAVATAAEVAATTTTKISTNMPTMPVKSLGSRKKEETYGKWGDRETGFESGRRRERKRKKNNMIGREKEKKKKKREVEERMSYSHNITLNSACGCSNDNTKQPIKADVVLGWAKAAMNNRVTLHVVHK